MIVLASKAIDDMPPLVGEKRTPELESLNTEGIVISSLKGGLMMLLLEMEFQFSSLFWEKKGYSTRYFKIANPRKLETIFQGNFSMTLTGLENITLFRIHTDP